MFRFISHKLQNKKWLNFCLLIGVVLLCGMISCIPMFKAGSLNKLIRSGFEEYAIDNNEYPAILSREGSCATDKYKSVADINNRINAYEEKWNEYISCEKITSQQILKVTGSSSSSDLGSKNKYLDIMLINNLDEHIDVVKGDSFSDNKEKQGTYPCYISKSLMDTYGFVAGEVITLTYCVDKNEKPVSFTIVGVIDQKSYSDNFWYTSLNDIEKTIVVDQNTFDELLSNYSFETVFYEEHMLLDYRQINSNNAENILYYLGEFVKADDKFYSNMSNTLKDYIQSKKTVETILWVLVLPIVILLVAFIYMVSNQILEMETGEIAMLKSRGIKRTQVIMLYVIQSGILSLIGLVIGIPIGYLFCKAAASTNAFLQFTAKDVSAYTFDLSSILYGAGAALVAVLFMTIPVIRLSRLSIVEQKSRVQGVKDKPFWEKAFLDIILLVVSIYLLYNYNKQKDIMRLNVISGEKIDPLVILDASLFIFAAGLLMLRLIKYLVRFIFYIGRNKWKPAMYASFLQITRTAKKQGFISVFLVMTIAMGVYNANMARTINQNNEDRISYDLGCDMSIQEKWKLKVFKPNKENLEWVYEEPDFERYKALDNDTCNRTRVIIDDNTEIIIKGKTLTECILMGINTKEFGETAELKNGLNKEHWYNYLNAIAKKTNGVIISRNVADYFGLKVGDTLSYSRYNPIVALSDKKIATANVVVCAIVDAWPGYDEFEYEYDEKGELIEKEKYLIVANYASVVNIFNLTPYTIWMKLNDDVASSDILNTISDNGIIINSYDSKADDIMAMKDSAMIQITNGMFTLSFLISIILCSVGFLIYWIMSIKKRELLFGIYRAMGMGMKEINKMLINEQIFGSLLAGIAGGEVGIIATKLFVKLAAIVYLPENHNVPLDIFISSTDMIKLFVVVAIVFVICFIVLRNILKNLKIAQALKLGED